MHKVNNFEPNPCNILLTMTMLIVLLGLASFHAIECTIAQSETFKIIYIEPRMQYAFTKISDMVLDDGVGDDFM